MIRKRMFALGLRQIRSLSTSGSCQGSKSYKLVVVGGGAGGCSAAAKFAKRLGSGRVAVIQPSDVHYYQAMWTLVGAGLKDFRQTGRPMADVLPKGADWLRTSAVGFDPENNVVKTQDGDEVGYEYLVVAMGLQLDFDKVKGLPEALDTPWVCSNYSPKHVAKTRECIAGFESGNAVFTFPKPPLKCPGAPQKIAYLAEDILRKEGKRDGAKIKYHTTLPVIFGVKKYADALWKVVRERGIDVTLSSNLVEVDGVKREAVFENLADPKAPLERLPYEMLHVTPPMSPPDVLKKAGALVDKDGYVSVDPKTLQHTKYPNVFSVGDCSSVPTSKTASAVAGQLEVLRKNLGGLMSGNTGELQGRYDGYTSCPLITGVSECILAEFDNSAPPQPMETFPFDQGAPRRSMFEVKSHVVPQVYWQMLKGRWEGPKYVRRLFHLGMSK